MEFEGRSATIEVDSRLDRTIICAVGEFDEVYSSSSPVCDASDADAAAPGGFCRAILVLQLSTFPPAPSQ